MAITSNRKILLGIVIAALALRIAVSVGAWALNKDTAVFYQNDTIGYIIPAVNLLTSGTFSTDGEPEILRTPGYCLLLIPGIVFTRLEAVTIALQIILGCVTVFLVYKVSLALFEHEGIALLSAALYALEPTAWMYVPLLYSDTLYTALLTLFFYFIAKYIKSEAVADIGVSAVVLAASAYTRPISVYLPVMVTALLGLRIALKRTWNRRLLFHAALFLMIAMGLIGVWQIRNKVEAGYFGFSSASANNLYYLVGAGILAEREGIPLAELQAEMGRGHWKRYFDAHPEQQTWGQTEINEYMARQGIDLTLQYPWTHLKLFCRSAIKILRDTGPHS